MSDHTPIAAPEAAQAEEPLLDALLREAVPEIKLALGDLIDRDNARSLPDRYAKLLPETTVAVTLRPDAAQAIMPIAAELERELSDSCMRHGSLYDRAYRVKLRRADAQGAPLFRVAALTPEQAAEMARPQPQPEPERPAAPPVLSASGPTFAAPRADESNATIAAPVASRPSGPSVDPDATRLGGESPAPTVEAGKWVLVVEDEDGHELESFPLTEALTTVGRRSEDPSLRSTVMLTDVPHVSRRQLALAWAPRGEEEPGFRVYNLGLNTVHLPEGELAGANVGRGPLRLDAVPEQHAQWVPPGAAMRIGEHGPVLRVVEGRGREVPMDPDATRFG